MSKKSNKSSKFNNDKHIIYPLNEKQQTYMDLIDDKDLTIAVGFPGTSKSLVAIYKAMQYYDDSSDSISKIIVTRNIVDADGSKSVGFLPGTVEEKTAPFLAPIYAILE